jgi:hypothetical protein
MRTRLTNFLCVLAAMTLSATAVAVGCTATPSNTQTGAGGTAGSTGEGGSGNGTAQGGNGGGGDGGGFIPGTGGGDGGLDPDSACAAQSAAATLTKKPVDIIFVIDNSGSMSQEIAEVQNQININFATIIENSGVDYRVIMIADFGLNVDESVCISEPLSIGNCNPVPAMPANNPPKFFHHDPQNGGFTEGISSNNLLCQLIHQLNQPDEFGLQPNGYLPLLRPGAFKEVVVITDDRSSNSQKYNCVGDGFDDLNTVAGGQAAAVAFDAAFTAAAPEHFGMPAARNYIFHSIVAMAAKDINNPDASHLPADPVITAECTPGAQNPGTGYQSISVLTGGLRHHSCGLNYTSIFKAMADSVIAGATVACDFAVPDPPMGQTVDLDTVEVQYTPGGMGAPTGLTKVADASACGPNSFYLDVAAKQVYLCPDTCTVVQADATAKIDVLFACEIGGAN